MIFPKNFCWGAATASYQVEGGIENCDWAKAAREGIVPACGRACDHYHLYESDFDLAVELGHNAHRFSIEWARIEPQEGKFNQTEIEHYRRVIRALKKRGLKPYTTLWHFTLPQWFADKGGFEHKDSPQIFARYAKYVVEQLKDELDGVTTMNEPNVFATHGWLYAEWPPFKKTQILWKKLGSKPTNDVKFTNYLRYFKVTKNLAAAHNAAYKAIKEVKPGIEVSLVKQIHPYAANRNPINKLKALWANYYQNRRFLRRTVDCLDEIGLNYYHFTKFGDKTEKKKTDMGWDFNPEHLYDAIKEMSQHGKPIFVSEAGLADDDDSDRAEYIEKQVGAVAKALEEGIEVRGHLYWSLLDNYEWREGFEKRFGLIEIDYKTLKRKVRPSAWVYKELIGHYSGLE